jgi:BsuBI/PstI restriction endonuclease domain
MRVRSGVKTTSPKGRWALTDVFADLFVPDLAEGQLEHRIEKFRQDQMSPGGKVKALTARQRGDHAHAVDVTLPDGEVRHLEPGEASAILKGVVEVWAPARLVDPVVLTISEPGEKIYTADSNLLRRLGLAIDPGKLLPDALLVDIGTLPPQFWIVEAVASDGPIGEARKKALLEWAGQERIPPGACQFLTAFGSRNAGAAKKRLKDLAAGTHAWYLDEPEKELAWYDLNEVSP